MSLPPGRRLGPYEILSPIGAGGMGEVLKAKDTRLQRTVAVKILPSELSSDAERRSRFEREAHAASALNHPNITTVFDIGEDEGTHYIVMELVEGKTLRELLDEEPLSTETLLPLATQIAEGLAKAHGAGIVHRDLKPENVMVTDDGLVKIVDFGLAKLVPQGADEGSEAPTDTRVTREGGLLGTVPYMSPEQAANRRIDYRSDQFSLGSILYEMATGKQAFQKDTVPETLAAIIEEDPEPTRKVSDAVPVGLSAVIERCLAKDPGKRYESTGDLAKELKAVPETSSVWSRRRKVLWWAAAALVAILALALAPNLKGLWDQLTSRAGPAPIESIAVLPLRNLSGDPEQEYFSDGMTEALITDLAKVSGLKVIAPHSAMRYKGTEKPLAEVARELGVDAVVEGSALRAGDSVRIMAQLIDPDTERALWAETYERAIENVLVLQGEVARAIAGELQGALTLEGTGSLADARPVNPEAHDAYVKGSFYWKTLTPEGLDTAQRYFELALEKDPSYAPAYEGLAWVWACRQQFGFAAPHEAGPKAKAAALRAIELDEGSAEAYGALGVVRTWTDWDWDGAEQAWRRALELDPNYPDAPAYYSNLLCYMGRAEEALVQAERALELDPFNSLFRGLYSNVFLALRRYDDAIEQCRRALELSPEDPIGHGNLWQSYHMKGMHDAALAEEVASLTINGLGEIGEVMLQRHAEVGYPGAMSFLAEALAALSRDTPFPPFIIASKYAAAGKKDQALEWLERGYEIREPSMPYIIEPWADILRPDPRFQDLLRRMNLPQADAARPP